MQVNSIRINIKHYILQDIRGWFQQGRPHQRFGRPHLVKHAHPSEGPRTRNTSDACRPRLPRLDMADHLRGVGPGDLGCSSQRRL